MNSPYVCLRCSHQLLRWYCQRRRSTFVSLGQLVGRDDDSGTTPQQSLLPNGEPAATGLPRREKRLTFAQKYQEQRKPQGVDKVLETLFGSNREDEQVTKRSRYSRTPKAHPIKTAAIERSVIIKDRLRELHNKLLRGTAPLGYIWADCKSLLGESNWTSKDAMITNGDEMLFDYSNTSFDTSANLDTFHDVLVAICQKQRLVIDGRDFTPAAAIRTYEKHGVMRHWWHHVLWRQLGHVLWLRYESTDEPLGAAADKRIHILLGEILEVWIVYLERHGLQRSMISATLSGASNTVHDKASTSAGFSSSFPKQLQRKLPDDTTVAAAMTLQCLEAAGMRAPLQIMSLFRRFGSALERNRSIATKGLLDAGVSSEITEKALEGWDSQSPPELDDRLESTEKPKESRLFEDPMGASHKAHDLDWSEHGRRARLAEIEQASTRSDTEFAMNLWRQYKAYLEAEKSKDKSDSTDRLYAGFLRSFWALRRYDHAIEVWNHMLDSGHPPSQKHWNAMLTGCVRAQDVESLDSIWTNMLRSGMPPNTDTWTTYIHGLIECHRWKEGLNALEQLGRIWKSAPPLTFPDTTADKTTGIDTEKPKDDSSLRPNINPINAALSALIHIKKRSLIPRVLAWAQSHHVPLETYTFNILLRPLVRYGSQDSIQAQLQEMADAKCTPDVATFSIILNGLVSNPTSTFHTLPPEAQESTITSMLADMERQGIVPNAFIYGTLLDGLLTPGSRALSHYHTSNVPAARTILAHMAARSIRPSPHIYTILITHYFARHPLPDLPAVSSLWSSIRHSGQTHKLDNIFFDCLIEGYADNNEIEESLRFLKMVPEQGKSPGWRALIRVLRALVRGKEWGRCGELVDDVKREGGLLRCGQGRVGEVEKTEFWELVDGLRASGHVTKEDEER